MSESSFLKVGAAIQFKNERPFGYYHGWIIGGPTRILTRTALWTVRLAETEGDVIYGDHSTRMIPEDHIAPRSGLSLPEIISTTDYSGVIENYCSECDEDEMVFYEGDYLCAWCREHLEDACLSV